MGVIFVVHAPGIFILPVSAGAGQMEKKNPAFSWSYHCAFFEIHTHTAPWYMDPLEKESWVLKPTRWEPW